MTRVLLAGLLVLASLTPAGAQQHGVRFTPRAWVTMVAATATLIRAANQSRIALVCTNNDGTNAVNLGDAVTLPTATTGVQLKAGASISITATSAIYGFPVAGTPTVSCSEES